MGVFFIAVLSLITIEVFALEVEGEVTFDNKILLTFDDSRSSAEVNEVLRFQLMPKFVCNENENNEDPDWERDIFNPGYEAEVSMEAGTAYSFYLDSDEFSSYVQDVRLYCPNAEFWLELDSANQTGMKSPKFRF